MNPKTTSAPEDQAARTDDRVEWAATRLDREYAELIEQVWSCERQWAIDDRINAAIKYGRV